MIILIVQRLNNHTLYLKFQPYIMKFQLKQIFHMIVIYILVVNVYNYPVSHNHRFTMKQWNRRFEKPHPVESEKISSVSRDGIISYGPNNFGDIMSDRVTDMRFLDAVTAFSPLERIMLTANGNLQRLLSCYYGHPITVEVIKCERTDENNFDREVDIMMGSKVICTATGKITVGSQQCLEAIESGKVGVGQLFRYLDTLPSFHLIGAGRVPRSTVTLSTEQITQNYRYSEQVGDSDEDICLWREYDLKCPQLQCRFLERFSPGFLHFKPSLDSK